MELEDPTGCPVRSAPASTSSSLLIPHPSSISLPEATYATIAPANPFILAASHSVIAVDAHSQDLSLAHTFSASATPIHSLAASTDGLFFTAAESDRYINVFSLIQQRQLGALVAESDVKKIAVNFNNEGETVKPLILAAVTAEGIVEVFNVPFNADSEDTEQVTSKRKKALTAKSVAQVRIIRPKTSAPVAAVDVSIQNGDLIIAWPEGGASMAFERVRCLDVEEGRLLLQGLSEIVKTKQISIGGENGNGSKELEDLALREANTVVVSGDTTNNLEIEDSEAEPSGEESDAGSESEAEAEPSFGEKFQALKISASANALAAPATSSKALAAPSAGSLTTVLSQALRTNDQSLLESCFQVTDSKAILSTIRQLESPQAVVLLERLAEKIARKPGRAGSLGTWVRWTLVAHGGYLVSLPDLVKTLSALHSTLNTRAAALPRLLALQGRLDMLNAQLELRHSVRHEGQVGSLAKERNKISEEEVTYIEGQDNESSDEDEEVGMEGLMIEDANAIKRRRVQNSDEEMSEDEDLMNGVDSDEEDEDEEDDEDDDDDNSLLDLEAEEASEDEEEEDEDDDELDYDSEEGEDLGSDDTDEDEEMVVPKGKKGKALGRSKR